MASHSFATSGSGRGCSAIPPDTTDPGRSSIPATPVSTVGNVRRALPPVLALLALLVPAPAFAAGPAPAQVADRPAGPLRPEGRWVTDRTGRVVVVHGVDLVARAEPWLPGPAGFGDDDARLLARAGFGAVRLGVVPAAVMPRPDAIDRAYLARIVGTVRLLARHGLLTLVVVHQDQWSPRYLGSGLPGWMTRDDGLPAAPRARSPRGYVTSPGLDRAFKSFWANRPASGGVGLMDRWTQIAGAVARALARERSLVGYDLMNAPWPGPRWQSCVLDGCAGFQRASLPRLWRRAVAQVRSVDADATTWIEPPALAPVLAPLLLPATGDRRRSGLVFQADCGLAAAASAGAAGLPCGALQATALDRAVAWSRSAGRPALLTGPAATRRGATVAGLRRIADARMLSWLRWPYANVPVRPGDQPGIVRDLGRPATGANVDEARLGALDTPYPRLIAGTPVGWSHAPKTGVFTASWSTNLPGGTPAGDGAVSELWLGRRTYPDGYRLTLTGARVVRRTADRVVVRALPGAARVTVTASPPAPARAAS